MGYCLPWKAALEGANNVNELEDVKVDVNPEFFTRDDKVVKPKSLRISDKNLALLGIRTRSMIWITPFVVILSFVVMIPPDRRKIRMRITKMDYWLECLFTWNLSSQRWARASVYWSKPSFKSGVVQNCRTMHAVNNVVEDQSFQSCLIVANGMNVFMAQAVKSWISRR